ncbi:helix-turn-helix domain-containing protein [Maribacter polysaccharolyticus]|uniref:helix-turn-helix domain-containing protein n=1 Tax=Maribacter polysaccharolyticus TaxID=3020831 RepID=UPI00237F319D|nr:AraC family transcriptional regulator [Maribacter polysaccharolyticus]MDE3741271.1 AraC family transcriptional regulator [Maribacter polysaccharolyticus]
MKPETINIVQIIKETTSGQNSDKYAVCWIKNEVDGFEIDHVLYENVSNSIFFLSPKCTWKIIKKDRTVPSGYILYLDDEVLNNPILSNLHINKVRLFNSGEIPLFKLSPGIEKRTQAILEMIDELLGSHLNHKDDAILSLLNTFFVYCDGQCNIKSIVSNNNSKTNIVYKFKKLVDKHIQEYHEVADYAKLLNISPKYLNECVKEVLFVSSKYIIIEQLLMRSRHSLKFSNKSIKEISFELGFSTPDYFSYFFKSQTGITPSSLRKS